ncbi:Uncharacterized protein dnm_056920 [Desulfonema magnum]|uniref:Uncharacterized protein n=1 Tax=Desulfonema magnum TaxID=45655 RepID=A0A975GQ36_9BACT|nr:Uncharacterized protein dnm_056920 [Desulfonema magnum]
MPNGMTKKLDYRVTTIPVLIRRNWRSHAGLGKAHFSTRQDSFICVLPTL